jgi:Cu/Zn superoxide dismutase
MSHGMVLSRSRRIGLASIICVMMLLVSPLSGAYADWTPVLQAPIQAASGAILGQATFTPAPAGGVVVYVQLAGFNPVAGSHHVAIANWGVCSPPAFVCAGSEVLVLPDLQLQSDGSATYSTVTGGVTMDWLRQAQGSAIVIHADSNAASAVIGCGVISAPTGYAPEGNPPRPGGPFHPVGSYPPRQDRPRSDRGEPPAPAFAHVRVVASSGLRLRGGPGTQYSILRIVPLGTVLDATGVEQYASGMVWARVCYNGAYYWAARQYLQSW